VALALKKYISLFFTLLKTSFIADLEYRVNFSLRIFTDIIWYIMQLISFEVLFNFTPTIGDWNRTQMRVFLGIIFFVDSFYMVFFQENLDKLSDKVRKGELDLILAKPVEAQFLISFQKMAIASFGNMVISFIFLIWTITQLENFNLLQTLLFLAALPTSIAIVYASRFFFACLNLIFVKSESVQFLWFNFYRLGMRPDGIYFPWLRFLLLTLIPMSMVASVPARLLFESPNWILFFWTLFIGPFFLYLSNKFWKYCLKFYSSASS
jgi:ABC-2 type transport system permease protein